jgi:hypothetical protein
MNAPSWLVQKRAQQCGACRQQRECTARFQIIAETVDCPRGVIQPAAEAIAARAWPDDAPRASGCCDSAINY